jgi:predicted ATP-grasp superfamily ATP-dependent carboligase
MPTQPLLLVVAQGGRFIAQSATRAGYSVRVADCFGDSDTLEAAEQWCPLPAISDLNPQHILALIEQLSADQPCQLICGTGVEKFYPVLRQLPAHIQLAGNSAETMARLREPQAFFSLLEQLKLPYPPTSLHSPPAADSLLKDLHTAGGQLKKASNNPLSAGQCYQKLINGESFSVLFLADGKQANILGWNRQLNRVGHYQLAKLRQPEVPQAPIKKALTAAVDLLIKEAGLKGFNSLDFIVDKAGRWYLLEVNPRISASLELLNPVDWVHWHIEACAGRLATAPHAEKARVSILEYLFAERTLQVSHHPLWPQQCHDLPAANSTIDSGMPICTLVVEADTLQAAEQRLRQVKNSVMENCLLHA